MTRLLVTPGRGPVECQIATLKIASVIVKEAVDQGLTAEIIEIEKAPHGAMSALVSLNGDTDVFTKSWHGTILWRCDSPLRRGTKRKNWYVGVSRLVMPEFNAEIREQDLTITACRASGPGGQHVNKTNSAVRITHNPSGITVFAQEERSQHRNRSLALARLADKMKAIGAEQKQQADRDQWDNHNNLERGNPLRAYDGLEFKGRVTNGQPKN
jgi:peptide chain release factor